MCRIRKNIEETCRSGLCTGCGTCVGLCPNSAIHMTRARDINIPILDKNKWSQRGICFQVCPGHSVDFRRLNLMVFGKEPQDNLIGNDINCYIGHSND